MKNVNKTNLVAFQNADGTVDMFERTFDGEPWGYGQTGYRRVGLDIIVEPDPPVTARVAAILVGLVAALAHFAGIVLLATWMPMGMA